MPAAIYAINIINSLLQMVPMAVEVFTSLQARRNSLEQMIAEKRDPTDAEWQALNDHISSLSAQLAAAKP